MPSQCQAEGSTAAGTCLGSLTSAPSSILSQVITREEWNALGSFRALGLLQGSLSSLTDGVADVEAVLPRPQRVGSFQERHHPDDRAAVAATGLIPGRCNPLDHGVMTHSMSHWRLEGVGVSASQAVPEARHAAFKHLSDTNKLDQEPADAPLSSSGADLALMRDLEAFARSLNTGTASGNAANLPHRMHADPLYTLPPPFLSLPAGAAAAAGTQHTVQAQSLDHRSLATPAHVSQQGLPLNQSNSSSFSALHAPAAALTAQIASGNQQVAENALLISLLNSMLPQSNPAGAGTRSSSQGSRALPLVGDARGDGVAMQSLLGQLLANQSQESEPTQAVRGSSDGGSELAQLLQLQQVAVQAAHTQAGIRAGVKVANVLSQQAVDRAGDGSPTGSQSGDEVLEARDAAGAVETAEAASDGCGVESPRDGSEAAKQGKAKGKGRMDAFRLKPRSMKERVRRERIR